MKFNTVALAAMLTLGLGAQAATGPSSSQSPYLVPTAEGVQTTSVLTVGDAADNGYTMVGIPDGMGAYDNGDGTLTVTMNHELGNTAGTVRAHGSTGAFVSKWVVRKSDLKVLSGQDMVQSATDVYTWDTVSNGWVAGTTAFNRLCSGDMAEPSAYWNPKSKKGVKGARIHMNGEEAGAEGRAFAWVMGEGGAPNTAWELPALGRFSWENAVANRAKQDKTIVVGTDDSSVEGQIYVYVGQKQASGNVIQKAGLHGGKLYAIKVTGNQNEDTSDLPFGPSADGHFTLVDVTPTTYGAGSGVALNSATVAAGGSSFLRPEDSAWDWKHPNVLYVATTSSTTGRSRIWQFDFSDIAHPELGGTVKVAGDGGANGSVFQMADNLTVDKKSGQVVFQEDVGNSARLGKVWGLDPASGAVRELAAHDADRFLTGGARFLTQDEESSAIIDVSDLLKGVAAYDLKAYRYYLLTTQAHYAIAGELVEGGQLQLMAVPAALVK
ncbi:alkaline phosphatase PhoX [Ideonella sp.]|uniref:alkaline phosphatase PhoX n=1 Tax=Ideonella sp. TaxID=1929293 RepID=UPI002B45D6A3|nr:alkaline phosphatase PhoX [Ideonella sp.]HJV70494.1 alkaline phosphatase PhoX [Ideonella sp.]